jgi:hypothetical protein
MTANPVSSDSFFIRDRAIDLALRHNQQVVDAGENLPESVDKVIENAEKFRIYLTKDSTNAQ